MAIPKEQQSAYQRWEMTSFGDDRPSTLAQRVAAAEAAPPPAPALAELAPQINLPSVEELEAMREAARQDGYVQGLEEGRVTGHAEGYADGARVGKQEAAQELERLRAIAVTFSDAVAQADETIATDVLELALRLARGMVRTAFDTRPDLILTVVRDAIDRLPSLQQPAIMTLNPDDAILVRDGMAEELSKGGWRIIEDAQLVRGGCKVETASNQIDAQAQARWQRLTHALGSNVDWLGQ